MNRSSNNAWACPISGYCGKPGLEPFSPRADHLHLHAVLAVRRFPLNCWKLCPALNCSFFFYVSTRHSSSAHLAVMSCAKRVLRMRGMFQAERPGRKRILVWVSWMKETVLVVFSKYFGYGSGYARRIAAPLRTHPCSKLVYMD